LLIASLPRCSSAPTTATIPHPLVGAGPANTAKLSSTLLQPSSGLSFAGDTNRPPNQRRHSERAASSMDTKAARRRRSSSLMYTEPPESLEHISDQAALPNLNSEWVNAKGAWAIHFVLIALLKIIFDIVPNISQETSWTLTNISYMAGSFLMFHWVRGVPFEFNAGAYDNLNMWEQIDSGDQYTPAKKFLLSVPIILFLVSTHYTHYDITYFMINFMATLAVVVPKLPALHRMRIALFNPDVDDR
ncbi:ORMDL family protein, partial [Aureobasidium pullulans]